MDNYIVSARKYRPSTFQSVVGQKSLTTTLKNAILGNKLAHAYLFCGPRGVGKTSCARIFAKTINCQHLTPEGEACNECESCRAFNEQRSFNIHELDAASNNSVDDIRSLIDQVRIPPQIGRYKVYIIDEVHMLSAAAFNAFLKTLEEPPRHALFILATTEKHKILPTILSRCQIYDFSRISLSDMVEHLQYVAACEGAHADADALNVIAQKADGGMRDALSVFDQVMSFTGGNITYQAVIDNLNVLDYEYYFRLTDAVLEGKVREALLILNEILNKGFEGQNVITGLAGHFRDLLVCRDEQTLVLFEVGASIRRRYIETAQRCSDSFLFRAIETANTCDLNYRASRNKRLLLELALIQLCQLSDVSGNRPVAASPSIGPVTSDAPSSQTGAVPGSGRAPVSPPPAGEGHSGYAGRGGAAPVAQPSENGRQTAAAPNVPPAVSVPGHVPPPAARKPAVKMGVSIKDFNREKTAASPAGSAATPAGGAVADASFSQEELVRCWNAFAAGIGEKVYLKNTMINCTPVLTDRFAFEVSVHNPGQRDELTNGASDILGFLRYNLHNTQIRMDIRVDEANEKRLAYTSTEKFNLLKEVNPVVAKLKDEFDLRIE